MSDDGTAADGGTARDRLRCGVFRVGDLHIAVPADVLREVVPRPARLDPLPDDVPGLAGAMPLREQVVAVADVRGVLGLPTSAGRSQVVVVVDAGDGVLGLVADAVVGVADLAAAQRLPVPTDGGRLFAAVFTGDGGEVVSLLDVERLVARGLPVVRRAPRTPGTALAGGSDALLLVRCATLLLGLDVGLVGSTLPALPLRDSPVAQGSCRGVVEADGAPLAVVDALDLLGLGTLGLDPGSRPQSVTLRLPDGVVGLAVDEVVDLVTVPADDVLPLPAAALPRPEVLVGVAALPGYGDVLVVDGGALAADDDLAALARIRTADLAATTGDGDDEADDDGARRAPVGEALLALDAGLDLVTPVEHVDEVLPLPRRRVDPAGADPARLGLVTHRGAALPLVSLPALLGQDPSLPRSACVLVVRGHRGPVGLVARRLLAVERSVWAPAHEGPAPATGDPLADALADRLLVRTAVVGTTDERRMRTRLDLRAVARALEGDVPGVPAPRTPADGAAPVPQRPTA